MNQEQQLEKCDFCGEAVSPDRLEVVAELIRRFAPLHSARPPLACPECREKINAALDWTDALKAGSSDPSKPALSDVATFAAFFARPGEIGQATDAVAEAIQRALGRQTDLTEDQKALVAWLDVVLDQDRPPFWSTAAMGLDLAYAGGYLSADEMGGDAQ